MNTIESNTEREHPYAAARETVGGGWMLAAVAGTGALVLSIIGLTGYYSFYMLTIAAISLGAAFVFAGSTFGAEYLKLTREARRATGFWSGMSGAELVGGAAGIVLGVLGIVGVDPVVLTAIAAIDFGVAFFFSSVSLSRLNRTLNTSYQTPPRFDGIGRRAIRAGVGIQVLIGLSAITLGIIALAGGAPLYLTLVAFLASGFAFMISGAAVAGRMYVAAREQ